MASARELADYLEANAIAFAAAKASAAAVPLSDVARPVLELGIAAMESAIGKTFGELASSGASAVVDRIGPMLGDIVNESAEIAANFASAVPVFQAMFVIWEIGMDLTGGAETLRGGWGASLDKNNGAAVEGCTRYLSRWYTMDPAGADPTPSEVMTQSLLGDTIDFSTADYLAIADGGTYATKALAESQYRLVVTKWIYEARKHGSTATIQAANSGRMGLPYDRRVTYRRVIDGIRAQPPNVGDEGRALFLILQDMLAADFSTERNYRLCGSLCNFVCNYDSWGTTTADVSRGTKFGGSCRFATPPGATFDDLRIAAIGQMVELQRQWNAIARSKPANQSDAAKKAQLIAALRKAEEQMPDKRTRPKVNILPKFTPPFMPGVVLELAPSAQDVTIPNTTTTTPWGTVSTTGPEAAPKGDATPWILLGVAVVGAGGIYLATRKTRRSRR